MEFIFGNVNEKGELEDSSELDPSLVSSLKSDYLSKILGSSIMFYGSGGEAQEKDQNAQDFSEIQELADDFSIELPSMYEPQEVVPVEKPVKKTPLLKEAVEKIKSDVAQGKIQFTSIFGPLTREATVKVHAPKKISYFHDHGFKLGKDDRSFFNSVNDDPNLINLYKELQKDRVSDKKMDESERVVVDRNIDDCFMPIEIDNWENRISRVPSGKKMGLFRNHLLDSGEWLDAVVEDEFTTRIILGDLDDPMIVFDTTKTVPKRPTENTIMGKDGKPIDVYNISNDWAYETFRTHKTDRVRQVVGPTKLEHAHCAIRLHFQYYKPNLTTKELRNWHRPPFKFPLHQDVKVSRVKAFKKKKSRGRDPAELLKSTKNISLKDNCQYVLLEYSEEYPLIMQNKGMASMMYNYYRKKDEKDSYAPKMPNGAAYILEHVDSSPFFCFGEILPGQSIQAIYNNLFRAPIFKHPVPETDFLLVRYTYKGKSKYYIREIPNVYVVGQCFPIQEIPPPSSRKLVHTIKGRVQVCYIKILC
jgi:transcription initiation factor TFIID subunit 1